MVFFKDMDGKGNIIAPKYVMGAIENVGNDKKLYWEIILADGTKIKVNGEVLNFLLENWKDK